MLKSFAETIYKQVVDVKPGRVIFGDEQRDEILYRAKRVRAKDYVMEFVVPEDCPIGQVFSRTFTTTANWYFIMTGVAVMGGMTNANYNGNELGIKFQNFYPTSPFGTEPENMGDIPYMLIGCEERTPGARWEEFKNLYYSLGQRFTVNVDLRHRSPVAANEPFRVFVIVTGLEFNLEEVGD